MVDLASIANKAAIIAFNVAGTAIQNVTYKQKGTAAYNPGSGVTRSNSDISVRMLMEKAGATTDGAYIVRADFTGEIKATVIASELGITPKANDLVIWGSTTRVIKAVEQGDPTGAIYELLLREPT